MMPQALRGKLLKMLVSGENIGSPLGIRDPDLDPLTFTLGGTDADLFDITSQGQLRTKSVWMFYRSIMKQSHPIL